MKHKYYGFEYQTKTNYVYLSYEENGRKYIGSRTCYDCTPEDDPYLGSYTDKTFHPTKKEILAVCETRNEANIIESFLQHKFNIIDNPEYANRAAGCFCQDLYSRSIFLNQNFSCPFNCSLSKKTLDKK